MVFSRLSSVDISVVIPSYNTQDTIGTTLKALSEQITGKSFEIIVVDCSAHELVKNIVAQYPRARYQHRKERFNPGEGRNIGAQLAQGQLLVFIDSDVQLEVGSLNNAWNHLQEGYAIFGGALELNTDVCADAAAYLEHYFFNHESQGRRRPCERSNLSSALMCFKRSVFLEAGGFKDIPRMQDTELTERLKKQGHKLHFFPDVLAYQAQDSPLLKVLDKIYINGQNLYYIRYKPSIGVGKKILFFCALPVISGLKIMRIIGRHLRYQSWPNKFRTLLISPLLILGGAYWMGGFYNALITEKGISRNR